MIQQFTDIIFIRYYRVVNLMRFIEAVLLIVSILTIISSGIIFHSWTHNTDVNGSTAMSPEANTFYLLDNYSATVLHNATVEVSYNGVTISIRPTIYEATSGKFVKETFKSGKLNRIDDEYQNSIGLIDQYSGTQMTYGYNVQGNNLSLTLVSTGGAPYVAIDIITPKAISASGGTMFFGGFNPHDYGKYVMGNGYSSFYESFPQSSLTLSWFQFTAINTFDYGSFSLNKDSTSLNLMFGPLDSNGVTLNSGPLAISMN